MQGAVSLQGGECLLFDYTLTLSSAAGWFSKLSVLIEPPHQLLLQFVLWLWAQTHGLRWIVWKCFIARTWGKLFEGWLAVCGDWLWLVNPEGAWGGRPAGRWVGGWARQRMRKQFGEKKRKRWSKSAWKPRIIITQVCRLEHAHTDWHWFPYFPSLVRSVDWELTRNTLLYFLYSLERTSSAPANPKGVCGAIGAGSLPPYSWLSFITGTSAPAAQTLQYVLIVAQTLWQQLPVDLSSLQKRQSVFFFSPDFMMRMNWSVAKK